MLALIKQNKDYHLPYQKLLKKMSEDKTFEKDLREFLFDKTKNLLI